MFQSPPTRKYRFQAISQDPRPGIGKAIKNGLDDCCGAGQLQQPLDLCTQRALRHGILLRLGARF